MEDISKTEGDENYHFREYLELIIWRRIRNTVIKYIRASIRNGGISFEEYYEEVLEKYTAVYDDYEIEEKEEDALEVTIKDMTLRVSSRSLFKALSSLAPREFESVYWGVAEDYDNQELADKMGYKSKDVAKTKKSHAIEKLREEMGVKKTYGKKGKKEGAEKGAEMGSEMAEDV